MEVSGMEFLVQQVWGGPKSFADFRFAELNSVAEMVGAASPVIDEKNVDVGSPFVMARLDSIEMATEVAKRCVMIKNIHEVWGNGDSLEAALKKAKTYVEENKAHVDRFMHNETFAVRVNGFGHTYSVQEQRKVMEPFLQLGWTAKVWFCRQISEGMRSMGVLPRFSLKTRPFIGPTSTCAELAFLMANQGQVRNGSLVFDPFVGTASLLVASSYFGAFCVGMDRDYCLLHSKVHKPKARQKDLFVNFKYYGLGKPEIVCGDNAFPPWVQREMVDAIICDPPYGVRAGARRTGSRKAHQGKKANDVDIWKYGKKHVPSSIPYPVEDVMADLLDVAAEYLVLGGRLVYLLPTVGDFDSSKLPTHPCLSLIAHSSQALTGGFDRRCITMKKSRKWEPSLKATRRDKSSEPAPCYADVAAHVFRKQPSASTSTKGEERKKQYEKKEDIDPREKREKSSEIYKVNNSEGLPLTNPSKKMRQS
eukprot:jgi/Bigna1/141471/aug1.63_g16179